MLVHNKKRAKWIFRLESLYKDKKSLVLTSDNNNDNEIKKERKTMKNIENVNDNPTYLHGTIK